MCSGLNDIRRSAVPRRVSIMSIALASLCLATSCHKNPPGSREFLDAAWKGDVVRVQMLLKDHPDLVVSKDIRGGTALHFAIYGGHKDVAELLLARQARSEE